MGGVVAGPQKARYAPTGSGRRRRSTWLLGGGEGRFPETAHQRDWVHKTANVLDALPKSVHRRAKKAIRGITEAEDRARAISAIEAFADEFSTKWPNKAVAKITDDKKTLVAFHEFPAEHWRHLRTTNPGVVAQRGMISAL